MQLALAPQRRKPTRARAQQRREGRPTARRLVLSEHVVESSHGLGKHVRGHLQGTGKVAALCTCQHGPGNPWSRAAWRHSRVACCRKVPCSRYVRFDRARPGVPLFHARARVGTAAQRVKGGVHVHRRQRAANRRQRAARTHGATPRPGRHAPENSGPLSLGKHSVGEQEWHVSLQHPLAGSTITWLYKPWCDASRGGLARAPAPPRIDMAPSRNLWLGVSCTTPTTPAVLTVPRQRPRYTGGRSR